MSVRIVFETHQTTLDNEAGHRDRLAPRAELSARGRREASELGERRRDDGLARCSAPTCVARSSRSRLAFGDSAPPVFLDWRLRECDYGELNGAPRGRVHADPLAHLTTPYPGGESWLQAVDRVGSFLGDLLPRWDGARVLVVGHVATHLGLDHHLRGVPVEEALASGFAWQPGWEYVHPGDAAVRQ